MRGIKAGFNGPCVVCGAPIMNAGPNANTCSSVCRRERKKSIMRAWLYANRKPKEGRTCITCGNWFFPKKHGINCSPECSHSYNKKNAILKYREANKESNLKRLSKPCFVCGGPLSGTHRVTCSTACLRQREKILELEPERHKRMLESRRRSAAKNREKNRERARKAYAMNQLLLDAARRIINIKELENLL